MYAVLIMGIVMLRTSCKEQRQDMKIVYYHKGEETTLNPKLSDFSELIKATENLLVTADDMLRLAVDSELIKKIKEEESATEVIFPRPIEFIVNYNKNIIHPNRILIPLSRDFVEEGENPTAVIFLGYPDYSSGPYTNHKGFEELNKILKDMGIK